MSLSVFGTDNIKLLVEVFMKCHIYPQQSMDRLKSSDILPVVSSVVSAAPDYPTPLDQCPSTDPPPGNYTYTDI